MILDEIQCGMGRTGYLFAYEEYGIKPDITTVAKALGCGVPVGAFVLNEKLAENSLKPGDHGTTYGGNPFALRAVSTVFDLYEEQNIVEHVKQTAPYLEQKLDEIAAAYPTVFGGRRGKGFLQGLLVNADCKVGDIILAAHKEGLLTISAEGNVLRLAPPLIITEAQIDEMKEKLCRAIDRLQA